MTYKGFTASIRYSEEDELLVGEIKNIVSVVTFEGESVSEIKKAFEEAVDSYLEFCKRKGK